MPATTPTDHDLRLVSALARCGVATPSRAVLALGALLERPGPQALRDLRRALVTLTERQIAARAGAAGRAAMTPEQRAESASKAARARWSR